jgi:hypothetical protein
LHAAERLCSVQIRIVNLHHRNVSLQWADAALHRDDVKSIYRTNYSFFAKKILFRAAAKAVFISQKTLFADKLRYFFSKKD